MSPGRDSADVIVTYPCWSCVPLEILFTEDNRFREGDSARRGDSECARRKTTDFAAAHAARKM